MFKAKEVKQKQNKKMDMEVDGKQSDGRKNMNNSENRKTNRKNKKKKQGQKPGQSMKVQLQLHKQKRVNSELDTKPNKGMKGFQKLEGKKKNVTQSYTKGEENVKMEVQKTKKPKKRNTTEFRVPSEKMQLTPLLNQEIEGRTSHRDERTLYVRFPSSLNIRERCYVEPLVPSAVDIRLPRLSTGCYAKFCYIEFETIEETATMQEKLSNLKINGEAFYVDFVGKKSKTYSERETRTVDPFRLYVGGLPKGIRISDLKTAFPTAARILYRSPKVKVSRSPAYLLFENREEALSVFQASKNLKLLGKDVIVMFATYNSKNELSNTHTAKKRKIEDVTSLDGGNGGGNTEAKVDMRAADDNEGGDMEVDDESGDGD